MTSYSYSKYPTLRLRWRRTDMSHSFHTDQTLHYLSPPYLLNMVHTLGLRVQCCTDRRYIACKQFALLSLCTWQLDTPGTSLATSRADTCLSRMVCTSPDSHHCICPLRNPCMKLSYSPIGTSPSGMLHSTSARLQAETCSSHTHCSTIPTSTQPTPAHCQSDQPSTQHKCCSSPNSTCRQGMGRCSLP